VLVFSTLYDVFARDVLSIGLAAYSDLLAEYRGLFRIAVALWALGISLEALMSEHSFRPTLIKFLRGAVVIVYLTEPAVPMAFSQLLQAPGHTSGVVVKHIVQGGGGTATRNFGEALDDMLEDIGEKTEPLIERDGWFSLPPIIGYIMVFLIFLFLAGFLAVVLYVAAMATFFQAALLFLLPFAVSLYPWSYTRPLFDGVIRQGLSFSLVIPLLNALLAMVVSPLVRALDGMNGLFELIPFACLCIVGALLALQIPAVAAGVAGGVGVPLLRPR
jgi:TrbL/VirB6 plasmid conjugal transfer protein